MAPPPYAAHHHDASPTTPSRRSLGQLLRCSNKEAMQQRENDTIALLMEQQQHQVVARVRHAKPASTPPHALADDDDDDDRSSPMHESSTPRSQRQYETSTLAVGDKGMAMLKIAQQIRALAEQLERQGDDSDESFEISYSSPQRQRRLNSSSDGSSTRRKRSSRSRGVAADNTKNESLQRSLQQVSSSLQQAVHQMVESKSSGGSRSSCRSRATARGPGVVAAPSKIIPTLNVGGDTSTAAAAARNSHRPLHTASNIATNVPGSTRTVQHTAKTPRCSNVTSNNNMASSASNTNSAPSNDGSMSRLAPPPPSQQATATSGAVRRKPATPAPAKPRPTAAAQAVSATTTAPRPLSVASKMATMARPSAAASESAGPKKVVLTTSSSATPPAIEVTMSKYIATTNGGGIIQLPPPRTVEEVEASLSLLEKKIQRQKERAVAAKQQPEQQQSSTRGPSQAQPRTIQGRSSTPGRPRLSGPSSRDQHHYDHPSSRVDAKVESHRRTSTPARPRPTAAEHTPERILELLTSQRGTRPAKDAVQGGHVVSATAPAATATAQPKPRSKSAGRPRMVRVVASSAEQLRSSSVGRRGAARKPRSPESTHSIEFVAFESTHRRPKRASDQAATTATRVQHPPSVMNDDSDNSGSRQSPFTVSDPTVISDLTSQSHRPQTSTAQPPQQALSQKLWNRMLGGTPNDNMTSKRDQIRDLDKIVMGAMTSSTTVPLSTSSSSTYPGMAPLNHSSISSTEESDAENRQSKGPRQSAQSAGPNSNQGSRSELSGVLSPRNDQEQVKYRSMMNDFEKGFEIFPHDKAHQQHNPPKLETAWSEAVSSSSSTSRYDPDVLRHRAAMSERLRRQQRKIEKLQRELNMSHHQRRRVQQGQTSAPQEMDMDSRTRGLNERRRTQDMLDMLDASLWTSNGECEVVDESALRNSTVPIRERSSSSKRGAKLIIRE